MTIVLSPAQSGDGKSLEARTTNTLVKLTGQIDWSNLVQSGDGKSLETRKPWISVSLADPLLGYVARTGPWIFRSNQVKSNRICVGSTLISSDLLAVGSEPVAR